MKSLSRVRLFSTPWTVAYQAPPSMGFSRQEYWSGLPFPSAGCLPNPGIEPGSPACQADPLTSEPPGVTGKFGFGVQNEAGPRLTEFCQENTLVTGNILFQQCKRQLYTGISPDGQY